MAWDSAALIASVKRRASVPTSQATLLSQDFLDLLNEELQGFVVPLLLEAKSEYLLTEADQIIAGQTSFRLPTRAIGGKLREVQFVRTNGSFAGVAQVSIDDLPDIGGPVVYVKGNTLNIWNSLQPLDGNITSIRMSYYQRPATLVLTASAGTIQSINGSALTLTGSPPAGFVNGASFDLVRASPGFECLNVNVVGNVAGNVVTMATAPSGDLAAGDYVCLAGQAPVAQIPLELYPLLEQATTVKVLQTIGDFEALDRAIPIRDRMEREARSVISQRIEGEPLKVVNRRGLLRGVF